MVTVQKSKIAKNGHFWRNSKKSEQQHIGAPKSTPEPTRLCLRVYSTSMNSKEASNVVVRAAAIIASDTSSGRSPAQNSIIVIFACWTIFVSTNALLNSLSVGPRFTTPFSFLLLLK